MYTQREVLHTYTYIYIQVTYLITTTTNAHTVYRCASDVFLLCKVCVCVCLKKKIRAGPGKLIYACVLNKISWLRDNSYTLNDLLIDVGRHYIILNIYIYILNMCRYYASIIYQCITLYIYRWLGCRCHSYYILCISPYFFVISL